LNNEEPEMDQRDEFTKWMSAVEEALTTEGMSDLEEVVPHGSECGCGDWNCPACFPEQAPVHGMAMAPQMEPAMGMTAGGHACPLFGETHGDDHEHSDEVDLVDVTMDEDDDAVAAFMASGGQVTKLPYMNKETPGRSFASKHIGSQTGKGNMSQQRGKAANVSLPNNPRTKPVVGEEPEHMMDEEPGSVEKPRSGKGVKLGSIVQKYVSAGEESPLTHGDDLGGDMGGGMEEEAMDFTQMPDTSGDEYGKAGRYQQDNFGMVENEDDAGYGDFRQEQEETAKSIMELQYMGLSNDDRSYTYDELMSYDHEELKQCLDRVMGTVSEDEMMPQDAQMGGDMATGGTLGGGGAGMGGGGGGYPPGTAPTMPESITNKGSMMEHADKDIQNWIGRFKAYDDLKASKSPMMEKKKPDFPDLDKDGDKDESIAKAAKDKKEKVDEEKSDKPWTDKSGKEQSGTAVKGKSYTGKEADKEKKKDKKDDLDEGADPEVLEWMSRFSKLGNMKGYGR